MGVKRESLKGRNLLVTGWIIGRITGSGNLTNDVGHFCGVEVSWCNDVGVERPDCDWLVMRCILCGVDECEMGEVGGKREVEWS